LTQKKKRKKNGGGKNPGKVEGNKKVPHNGGVNGQRDRF